MFWSLLDLASVIATWLIVVLLGVFLRVVVAETAATLRRRARR